MAKGREAPDWYTNRPEDLPEAGFFLGCYMDLRTGVSEPNRSVPWRDVLDYASWLGLDGDMTLIFKQFMSELDEEFQRILFAKTDKEKRRQEADRAATAGRRRK